MNDHIIHSYALDPAAPPQRLEGDAISEAIKNDALAWVHLDAEHENTRPWLKSEVSYLDSIVLEALLAGETRPRIEEHKDGVIVILRGMNFNENAEVEDMVSLRLWLDPHRIITMRRRPIKALTDMDSRLAKGKGPSNPGDFLNTVITQLLQRMEPIMQNLDDQMDGLEERVIENPSIAIRKEVVHVRKQAIMFRRYMAPQRDAIAALRDSSLEWLNVKQRRVLQESYNRMMRYIEDLDAVRERSQIVQDELTSALSDKLNKNMYILSVVAAIFLPLGFFTGLLGINVGGIPGAEDISAFWKFCALLTATVIVQIIFFKWKKWI